MLRAKVRPDSRKGSGDTKPEQGDQNHGACNDALAVLLVDLLRTYQMEQLRKILQSKAEGSEGT